MASAAAQLLIFELAGRALALPAGQVREVVRRGRLTSVPQAPASLLGLANVRGMALPVLSCAALLDMPAGPAASVIILEGAVPVGLAVDQVRAVVRTDSAEGVGTAETLDIAPLIARHYASLATRPPRRGERVAARRALAAAEGQTRILSFTVGAQRFAFALPLVEAVIAVPAEIAALPRADAAVIGTTSWRGGLLPIFSLAALLDLPAAQLGRSRVVVIRIAGHPVGCIVDAIGAVIAVDDRAIDPLPPVLARSGAEARIAAVVRLDGGRLLSLLAPDRLLDEALTARLVADASREEQGVREVADVTEAVLLLTIAGQRYGLPLAAVDEIARLPQTLTRLPRAPDFVRGVMQMRGRALAVVDQARRFGAAAARSQRVVIARSGELEAAFLVDQVLGLIRVPEHALVAAPAVGDDPQLFDAVLVDGEDRPLTLLLSPFTLLDGTERAVLAALTAPEATPRP